MALPSFVMATHTNDRGRHHTQTTSQYQSWDFLKHTTPQAQAQAQAQGCDHFSGSSTRESKFKVGFYRRPHDAIAPAAERHAYEQQRAERSMIQQQQRAQTIREKEVRHGNIITHKTDKGDDVPAERERIHKKHIGYQEYREGTEKQNRNRQREGSSRFHVVLDDEQAKVVARRYSDRYHPRQEQRSCVLGYGRADLPSSGVLDAFVGHGYTTKDLVSRHTKLGAGAKTEYDTNKPRDTIIAPQPSTIVSRPAKRAVPEHRASQRHESPIC